MHSFEMLIRSQNKCPYCQQTFDISLSDALSAMNRREWKVYCPACYTGVYFRFGFGASFLASAALVASLTWGFDFTIELALVVYFPSFALAGLAFTVFSPLVAGSFEQTQYERKASGSSHPTHPSAGPAA